MTLPIATVFEGLPDPRRETLNRRHLLTDILTLATCAVIAGADTWDDIAEFGHTKEAFFRRFLSLPNGVPSPDTFARVFAKLDRAAFPELLRVLDLEGAIVTIDAAGTQVENAALIREGGGHYLLAVKGNQPTL